MKLASIEEVLAEIADRSFYEDCTITPEGGAYLIEESPVSFADEQATWEYETGLTIATEVTAHSGLQDSYVSFTVDRHIDYNMPEIRQLLESGHAITVGYGIAYFDPFKVEHDTGCEFGGDTDNDCYCDLVAGWYLAVIDEGKAQE